MPPLAVLHGLARLVALMRGAEPAAELRRALRAVARAARRVEESAVAELDAAGVLRMNGEPVGGGEEREGVLAGLRAIAAAHGVGRIVVRAQAPARELAQLAGVLARAEGGVGDPVTELATLRLWHVQLERVQEAGAPAGALPDDLERTVARLHSAADAGESAAAVAELRRWVAAAGPATGPVARVLARVLADTLGASPGDDRGRVAALAELLVALDLRPVVDAALGDGAAREDALLVLQCITPAAVPLLVERLAEAATLETRRRCCDALLALGSGIDVLVAALDDPRWYLARNAALLLGELQAAEAVRPLARALGAADARVRVAAAGALARIGNVPALHVLCGALGDRAVEVRRLAARGVADGTRRGAVVAAATCIAALERESDVDASLELLAALGRIDSVDAIRYLHWTAVGRTRAATDWELRATAIAALFGAHTPEAHGAQRALLADPDPTVRRLAAELSARADLPAA